MVVNDHVKIHFFKTGGLAAAIEHILGVT
jgi:hypothetical protein